VSDTARLWEYPQGYNSNGGRLRPVTQIWPLPQGS